MKNKKEIKEKREMTAEEREKRSRAIKIISLVVGILLVLSAVGYIVIQTILGGNGFSSIVALAEENPFITALVLAAINFVQVIIALIPGEIVEQACGVLGPLWGTLVCIVSTSAASALVLFLVKKFGRNLVYTLYPKEKIDSISFLHDPKKRNMLTLFLFLIPGTPKDLLTYAVGLTDMSIPLYLALTTFARLPSIVMSTVSGDWIADMVNGNGGLIKIILLNAISLVLCGVGYLIYMLISKKHNKKVEKMAEDPEIEEK